MSTCRTVQPVSSGGSLESRVGRANCRRLIGGPRPASVPGREDVRTLPRSPSSGWSGWWLATSSSSSRAARSASESSRAGARGRRRRGRRGSATVVRPGAASSAARRARRTAAGRGRRRPSGRRVARGAPAPGRSGRPGRGPARRRSRWATSRREGAAGASTAAMVASAAAGSSTTSRTPWQQTRSTPAGRRRRARRAVSASPCTAVTRSATPASAARRASAARASGLGSTTVTSWPSRGERDGEAAGAAAEVEHPQRPAEVGAAAVREGVERRLDGRRAQPGLGARAAVSATLVGHGGTPSGVRSQRSVRCVVTTLVSGAAGAGVPQLARGQRRGRGLGHHDRRGARPERGSTPGGLMSAYGDCLNPEACTSTRRPVRASLLAGGGLGRLGAGHGIRLAPAAIAACTALEAAELPGVPAARRAPRRRWPAARPRAARCGAAPRGPAAARSGRPSRRRGPGRPRRRWRRPGRWRRRG